MTDRSSEGTPPTEFDPLFWERDDSRLLRHISAANQKALAAYEANPVLVYEHANIERSTAQGGYGRRQLYELIQNGADALVGTRRGRIHVVLTDAALYCANEGEPIDPDGVTALLNSHISRKRGREIGRFGLGFKSVLGVTDCPEFYSWSGSFSFNAEWSRQQILERVGRDIGANDDDRTPTLRLAEAADPVASAESDPVLKELMAWATTVVKLPLAEASEKKRLWLAEDLEAFPREFMLFSPHVADLRLEDRTSHLDRRIEVAIENGVRRLTEGSDTNRWRVFEVAEYRPSGAALEDAGELAHREAVPVIWAVPTQGKERQQRGRFWAFFPTEYETTLAGIVNAPWKTNEDRQNLLSGAFNDELVGVVVDLVINNLKELVDPDDPGSYLELLPARGREAPSPTDRLLTELFYKRALHAESLPDQQGVLRLPSTIQIHPVEATPRSLEHWAEYPNRPMDWCHKTVFQRDRRACAERLRDSESATIQDWLEALVADETSQASMSAVRAAAALSDDARNLPEELKWTEIVEASDGTLVAPDPDLLFLPAAIDVAPGTLTFVHPDLVADPETMAALEHLGIRRPDGLAGLRARLAGRLSSRTDWEAFWPATRGISVDDSAPLIVDADQRYEFYGGPQSGLHVRTMDGRWRPLHTTLLPGAIVPTHDSSDEQVTIDTGYHADDIELLERLGARSSPVPGGGTTREPWFQEYRSQALREYYESLETKARPRENYLAFDREAFAGPLSALPLLSPEGRSRLTEAVLNASGDLESTWTLGHSTMNTYPDKAFISPALWLLRTDGYLRTSLGPKPVGEAVGSDLRRWARLLPVATQGVDPANILELPLTLEDLSADQWQSAVLLADELDIGPAQLGSFYAAACRFCESPATIRCRVGESDQQRNAEEVAVVASQEHFETLVKDSIPVLMVEHAGDADTLVEEWRLIPASAVVRTTYSAVPTTLGSAVRSRFPDLALMSERVGEMTLQPCDSLLAVTYTDRGRVTRERDFVVEDDTIFYGQFLSDLDLLFRISEYFDLGLDPEDIDAIVEAVRDAERRELLREIAREPDDAARLSRLLGDEVIARRLPQGLLAALNTREFKNEHALAQAALAVYGAGVLREYHEDLADRGWLPPPSWMGGQEARAFVREIGLAPIFAGSQRRTRPPYERVDGPALLPPLHPFQARIAETTRGLLRGGNGRRALLSLPTGAGKTRIAVEAIVEAIKADELTGPTVWIAQTEELCEQAVETWSFVWRAIGPQHSLHISRLWASYEAEPVEGAVQVVVTTIAKILNRVDDPDYDWLSKAGCVIVDEAHGSTTTSYTQVLNWLGFARNTERVPLIGLTATPFRGTSAEQTTRLVRRYGSQRLDHGVFDGVDPYVYLQGIGVLAEVDHQILAGSEILLTDVELAELEQRRRLPSNVGERIGANQERNNTIIEEVLSLPDEWPILLFAASVDHAQTLAALLTLDGVPSAAVSGQTDRHVRRHYVEQFRTGEIRVLTNYNVFTQGFDAPATRAVIVARPTFSANLYQQMIGRGLRGPLNGGKERCLIVNVEDNVVQYGEQLAFYDFEYLWDGFGDDE